MRTLIIALFASVMLVACTSTKNHYGQKISSSGAIEAKDIPTRLANADSIYIKAKGEVTAACQSKGCWMTMDLSEKQSMRVKFKDYGFFVPLNSAGKEAVIEGWAYRQVVSVDEQRHYAQDAGKSKEEIMKITEPLVSINFYADGVILKDK